MASTIAIAASFQIDPSKLEIWAKGDKPTDEQELKICNEIFSQFQFVDGEWSPIKAKAKKTKTTKAKDKKKGTKKAASTTDSEAASKKYNTESIVSEKSSNVAASKEIKTETAEEQKSEESTKTTAEVDSTATRKIAENKTSAVKAKSTKTKKKSAKVSDSVEDKLQPNELDAIAFSTTTTEALSAAAERETDRTNIDSKTETAPVEKSEKGETASKASDKTGAEDKPVETKDDSKDKSDSAKSDEEKEAEDMPNKVFFTAVGMIRGEVTFDDAENQHTVKVAGKTYRLFYTKKNYLAFTGLKKEIESTGNSTQRLIVYPKFTHFPKKEQPPRVGFQLVGFDKGAQPLGITSELKDNEFKLCGIWQFIPVCRQPCISIFRNFNRDRLDYIKQAEVQSKVNFMKASHLPVLWRDGPVRPFRFNPRLEKDQQAKTYFVQIKAKFLPQRDCFGFSESLADPIEKPPKFLKASKADKAEVMKKVAKNKPPGKGLPPGRGKPPARSGNKPSGPKKVINKPVGKSAPGKQQ